MSPLTRLFNWLNTPSSLNHSSCNLAYGPFITFGFHLLGSQRSLSHSGLCFLYTHTYTHQNADSDSTGWIPFTSQSQIVVCSRRAQWALGTPPQAVSHDPLPVRDFPSPFQLPSFPSARSTLAPSLLLRPEAELAILTQSQVFALNTVYPLRERKAERLQSVPHLPRPASAAPAAFHRCQVPCAPTRCPFPNPLLPSLGRPGPSDVMGAGGRGFSARKGGGSPRLCEVLRAPLRGARVGARFSPRARLERSAGQRRGLSRVLRAGRQGHWKGEGGSVRRKPASVLPPSPLPTHLAGQQARLAQLLGLAQFFQAALQLRAQSALGRV